MSVDGARLRVAVRRGGGSRPPLLLMNGIGAALESFQPLVDMLDPVLDVIRFDVPGVGGSPPPARPYRFPALARLVGRMLDELGVAEVDVLGISWGGGLAQQFAWTERRRCRRLVLVATGTGAMMVPGSPSVLAKLASPRRYGDPTYMIRIAPELYGGSIRRDPDRLRRVLHALAGPGDGRGYALQLAAGLGWTSVGFLPMVPQRTLVLTGDDDPIIPVANGRILAALIRRSTLHVYRGGHVELVADPAPFAVLIEQFLSDADAPAGGRRSRRIA